MRNQIATVARLLLESKSTVIFTGAGISTESQIPDFRSPGGVWARSKPVYFDEYLRSAEARLEYWRQKTEADRDFAAAKPNVTHQLVARWEEQGLVRGVITQNIDGLHQDAGTQNILELHGTARWILCLECGDRQGADAATAAFLENSQVPVCGLCGGLVKHATISFGQSLEKSVLEQSTRWASEADLFIVMGSSLVVEPAASLPVLAVEEGAKLVILNRESTPLDGLAEIVIHGELGEIMARLGDDLERLQSME